MEIGIVIWDYVLCIDDWGLGIWIGGKELKIGNRRYGLGIEIWD